MTGVRPIIDTEEAESTERIRHRDTETQRHIESLCLGVSVADLSPVKLVLTL